MWFVIPAILTQVLIFVALILIFRRILTKNVVSATKHIDEINQEYTKREEEAAKKLTEATKRAQDIIARATDEAQVKKEEIFKKVEEAKQEMLKEARGQAETIVQQADRTRQALIGEVEERIDKEAINKATELIQYALPDEIKLAAHAKWTEELIENGFENIGEVKISEGVKEIKVIAAFPLKAGDRAKIVKKVNGLLGTDMEIKEELDPKIAAGIIVEIGNLVLDGSLRNKILEHTAALNKAEKDSGE